MTRHLDITLDERDDQAIFEAILARSWGYVPEWKPADDSAGAGLARIASRYLHAILQRLNQAPEKNRLAFLDLMGEQLVPAQAARVPIVFQLSPDAAGGTAPSGTAVAAPPPPGGNTQIVFETERALGVAPGKLAQVVSLWPGRDEYIDHSTAFLEGVAIRLFDKRLRRPVPHDLYLAHDRLLALAGSVELFVDFDLSQPSAEHLDILWEYWDGELWREFLNMKPACTTEAQEKLDGTNGLTRSGRYVLQADCAESAKTAVAGVEACWIRGRLTEPLPVEPEKRLPEVRTIRLSSAVNRPLQPRLTASESYSPRDGAQGAAPFRAFGLIQSEAGLPLVGAVVRLTERDNPSNVYTAQDSESDGRYEIDDVAAEGDYDLQLTFQGLSATVQVRLTVLRPGVDLTLNVEGLSPDKAYADGTELDLSKPFYPFGLQPQPGSTFYFSSEELLSKPGARVRMFFARTKSPLDETGVQTGGINGNEQSATPLEHTLRWEYWNGRAWALLQASTSSPSTELPDFTQTGIAEVLIPDDIRPTAVEGEEALWIRCRLVRGGFGIHQRVTWLAGQVANHFDYVIPQPPVLANFRLGYSWADGPVAAERVTTYNDFRYRDHTADAQFPGTSFQPYQRVEDLNPALYLGLEKKPPVDRIGLYFDIEEDNEVDEGPALDWSYWNGATWQRLSIEDETANLRRPGLVSFIGAHDSAALARFSDELHWVRASLREDGPPDETLLRAVHLNAVWASQRQTFTNVPLGASSGQPNQTFRITQIPVLQGERLEVREVAGARAAVEWRILATEIFAGNMERVRRLDERLGEEGDQMDFRDGDLRLRRGRNKTVEEVWVAWSFRPHLFFSAAGDRHYTLDRALGQVRFGDGTKGRIPPIGANIAMAEFRAGGGAAGNVAAKTVNQLLGAVAGIEAIFNPVAAEGGADGETLKRFAERAPRSLRHRGRAITPGDYETMAREASPAVGFARAIATRNRAGRRAPSWVTVIVIPVSDERRPWPSAGLRDHVRRYLESRAPAELTACGGVLVTGPAYLEVDLTAKIAPVDFAQAGVVERRAREALERFLHPLYGGPDGRGWSLGRDLYRSDLATLLEAVEGVDYVEEVVLLRDGYPQGERIAVPWNRIVVAGQIGLALGAAKR